MDWFLYDNHLRHERIKLKFETKGFNSAYYHKIKKTLGKIFLKENRLDERHVKTILVWFVILY